MCRKFGLALSPVNSFFGEPPPSWDRVKTPNFGTYLVPGYYLVLFVYSLAYWMLVVYTYWMLYVLFGGKERVEYLTMDLVLLSCLLTMDLD